MEACVTRWIITALCKPKLVEATVSSPNLLTAHSIRAEASIEPSSWFHKSISFISAFKEKEFIPCQKNQHE